MLNRAIEIIRHNGGNIIIEEGVEARLFPEYDGTWSVVLNGNLPDGRKWCETYDSYGNLVNASYE